MSYQQVLGPFGTVWPGPQRIVLQIVDDHIAAVEQHGGYHARGCAARLVQLPLAETGPLVNRVCGVHGLHHALAWTLALEKLDRRVVPPRAHALRVLAAEAERVAAHLQVTASLVGLLGLLVWERTLLDLRERTLGIIQTVTGHRLVHDWIVPGGVQHPLHTDETRSVGVLCAALEHDLHRLIEQLLKQRGLAKRLAGIGHVTADQVVQHKLGGVVARAGGSTADLRRDQPYDGYLQWTPQLVQQQASDVAARLFAFLLESYESSMLMTQILGALPGEEWRGDVATQVAAGTAVVAVEAPSRPLRYCLTSDGVRLTAVEIAGTPLPNADVLAAVLAGQSAEDAALVIASLASCTACAEA